MKTFRSFPTSHRSEGTLTSSTNVFSLPPELLRMIFLRAWDLYWPQITLFDRRCPPVNLSQTCRLWRDVALNTSELWNKIQPIDETPFDVIQLWISRARGRPLVLDLTYMISSIDPTRLEWTLNMEKLFTSLVYNYSSSVAEFRVSEMIPGPIMLYMTPSQFPMLRTVCWTSNELAYTMDSEIETFEHFWSMACSIPSLRNVSLVARVPRIGPWNQLTELRLTTCPVDDSLRVLAQATELRRLDWSVVETRVGPRTQTSRTPIILPHLTALIFYFFNVHGDLLLGHFITPNIQHIKINIPHLSAGITFEAMIQLLSRSNARLRSFELPGVGDDAHPGLLSFLQSPCFNSLRWLLIRDGAPLETVWSALSQSSFLPSLEELQLGINLEFSIDAMVPYIRTREKQGSKLTRVVFFIECDCRETRRCTKQHHPFNITQKNLELCTHIEMVPKGQIPWILPENTSW